MPRPRCCSATTSMEMYPLAMPSVNARRNPSTRSASTATKASCDRDTRSENSSAVETPRSQPAAKSSCLACSNSAAAIARICMRYLPDWLPTEFLKPLAALEILDADPHVRNGVFGKASDISPHQLGAFRRLSVLRRLPVTLEPIRQEEVDARLLRSA